MSETATKPAGRLPPQTKYIVGNEACERFSYYGIRGILAGYITGEVAKGGLGQNKDTSTIIIALFVCGNYFMPLFGAWLSDKLIGRYYTILYVSLVYCLGNGVLACSGLLQTVDAKIICLCAGLALIALGSGGIKPCVSAFMGDQFKPDQSHLLQKAYGAFYWSINFGSFFSFLVIPWIKNHHVNGQLAYGWAFGVPGILMALATLIFWLGTKHYTRVRPTRETQRAGFLTVLFKAFANQPRWTVGPLVNIVVSLVLPLVCMVALAVVALCPASWAFHASDIRDVHSLCTKLREKSDPVSEFLLTRLSKPTQQAVLGFAGSDAEMSPLRDSLAKDLDEVAKGGLIYEEARFQGVKLTEQARHWVDQKPAGAELARLNRLLLEESYAKEISKDHLAPFARDVGWAALFGVGVWYLLIVVMSLLKRLELPDRFWEAARSRFNDSEVAAARSVSPILFVFALVPAFWMLFDQTTSTWVMQGEAMVPCRISGGTLFSKDDLKEDQARALAGRLRAHADPVSQFLWNRFPPPAQQVLADTNASPEALHTVLVEQLNPILRDKDLYAEARFKPESLSVETRSLLARNPEGNRLVLLNRLLLSEAYSAEMGKFGFSIGPEEMQSANPALVMILVPLLTLVVYPWLGRRATPLRRMGVGMFLAAASYVIVAWLQQRLDAKAELSVMWQVLPYTVLTTGEVLLSTTGLEFAFGESAPEMRSTIMSFWLLTVSVGNLLVADITKLMSGGSGAEAVSPKRFLIYAGLTAVVGVLFSLVASQYRYRHDAFKAE
jgi:dipeptide/tripeptide permease